MKSFAHFLQELNDGQTHAGLCGDLDELLHSVQSTHRGGSITLKIKIAPASKGSGEVDKITITADRKLELPKPEQPSDFFWLTDSGEPTRKHPRQHELELRDINTQPVMSTAIPLQTPHNAFTPPDSDGVITFKTA